jgi:hypothetical protein
MSQKFDINTIIVAAIISTLLSVGVSYIILPKGLQGPPGPTGATGPQGPAGPQGSPGDPFSGFVLPYDYTSGTWNTVATWSGSATRKTELFYIPSGQMKISWSLYNVQSFSSFSISLYIEGGSYPSDSWLFIQNQKVGETMAYIDPGNYYLDLSAYELTYQVTVQVYVP